MREALAAIVGKTGLDIVRNTFDSFIRKREKCQRKVSQRTLSGSVEEKCPRAHFLAEEM